MKLDELDHITKSKQIGKILEGHFGFHIDPNRINAESAQLIKKTCGFEGEIVFDTKYPDGDAVKILGNSKLNDILPDFKFFDHEQGISNTVKYYEDKI